MSEFNWNPEISFSAAFISSSLYYDVFLLQDIQDNTEEQQLEQTWKVGFLCQADGFELLGHRGSSSSTSLVHCILNPTILLGLGSTKMNDMRAEIP